MSSRLAAWIFASFCTSWVSLGAGWWAENCTECSQELQAQGFTTFEDLSVFAAGAWIIVVSAAFLIRGREARYLLLFALFALFWPIRFAYQTLT